MFVKKGEYAVIAQAQDLSGGQKSPDDGKKGGNVAISKKTIQMEDIPLVGQETPGAKTTSDLGGKQIKTKVSEYTGKKKSRIHKGKIDWDSAAMRALGRATSSVSSKIKRLIDTLSSTKPLVNWKMELKKFFDSTFNKQDWVLPNKRFVARGEYLYGRKNIGSDTLKTIVAAVDTSGSISQEQSRTFVTEVMHLVKMFDADKTYIIYCSDDIDNVDIIKKGGQPDFSLWATTGGNAKGFIPPFQYVEKNNIKPSVFIYLTDTGGEMPDPKKYGIPKYIKKVIWFICSPTMYNPPSFGKILFAPASAIAPWKKK
jgi:predicted metal-dependent peptidase